MLGLPERKAGRKFSRRAGRRISRECRPPCDRAHVRFLVAGYKVLKSYGFTETLLLSGGGKAQKNVLCDKWQQALGNVA